MDSERWFFPFVVFVLTGKLGRKKQNVERANNNNMRRKNFHRRPESTYFAQTQVVSYSL